MTATDWDQTNHTDYGAADSLGSGSAAPSSRRRQRRTEPEYKNSVLADPQLRALIAGYLEEKVAELISGGGGGESFIASKLDEAINEFRGVE